MRKGVELDTLADLRKQHEEFLRLGYDGHNRHSGITSMHDLRIRTVRRKWRINLNQAVKIFNKTGN